MAPTLVLTLQLLAKRSSSRPRNTTSSSRAAAAASHRRPVCGVEPAPAGPREKPAVVAKGLGRTLPLQKLDPTRPVWKPTGDPRRTGRLGRLESRIENLQNLTELNTLVISHNSLKAVVGVDKLQKLKKLSASHNNITELPDLSSLSALRELRLSHNEIVQLPPIYTKLPPEIEILDLGHNRLASLPSVTKSLSQRASKLRQLNLKGNSVCEVDGYRNTILAVATSLKILDGERFDPKFLERREKRRIANTKNEESESKRSEASKGVSSAFNGSGPRPLHMMVENDTETSEKPRDQAAKKRGGAALPESNSKRQKLSSDRPSEAVAKGGETPAQSDVKAPSGNSSAGPNTVAKSKGNPKASSSDEGGPPTNAPSTVPPNRTAPVKKGEAEPWMTTDDVRARSGVVAVIDATKNKRGRGKKHPNVVPMDPSQLVPGFGDLGTTRVVGGWD
ncbi:hypothetical protein DFJ73DRAFT_963328 [Zopfochytrium polystomum]|nr:hypothetical protein DFJ73DRAFT_963328 [Zopfochytrium polystomum]